MSGGVHLDFFGVSVSKASLTVLSDLSSLEKFLRRVQLKAFFHILSGSEFDAFLGYGNEVEAFAKNRFFSVESGRFSGIVTTV